MSEDFNRPSVTIVSPASGASVKGVVTVEATAWDDVGIRGVSFHVNGLSIGVAPKPPYKVQWKHRDVPQWSAKLTVYSFDSPGNNSAPAFRNVTISNFHSRKPPVMVIESPADGQKLEGQIVIKASATPVSSGNNPGSPVRRLDIEVDGEPFYSVFNENRNHVRLGYDLRQGRPPHDHDISA